MAPYAVHVGPAAKREIKKLAQPDQRLVIRCLEGLALEPRPRGVEKLSHNPRFWRIRAGNYRVIYHIDDEDEVVIVLLARHRKDAYRDIGKLDVRLIAAKLAPLLIDQLGLDSTQ